MKQLLLSILLASATFAGHGQSRYRSGNKYDMTLNSLGTLWDYVQRVDAALDSLIKRTDSLRKRIEKLEGRPFWAPTPDVWYDLYGHRFKISDTLYTVNGQSYLPIFPETYEDGWVAGAIDTVNDFEIHTPLPPNNYNTMRLGDIYFPGRTESSIIPHSPDDNFEYALPPLLSADSIKRKPSQYSRPKKHKRDKSSKPAAKIQKEYRSTPFGSDGWTEQSFEVTTKKGTIQLYKIVKTHARDKAWVYLDEKEVATYTRRDGWKISDSAGLRKVKQLIIRNKTDSL